MWLGGGVITRPVLRLSEGRPRPYTQLALWMTQLGLEVAAEKRGAENGNRAHGHCVIFVTVWSCRSSWLGHQTTLVRVRGPPERDSGSLFWGVISPSVVGSKPVAAEMANVLSHGGLFSFQAPESPQREGTEPQCRPMVRETAGWWTPGRGVMQGSLPPTLPGLQ